MAPYERLKAWQGCHSLVLLMYEVTTKWPRLELFTLTSQVRRAAISAPTNLVEGSAKLGPREFRRYLDISNGSLAELQYLLHLAHDLGYLTPPRWRDVERVRDEAARLVWGLYRAVQRPASRARA